MYNNKTIILNRTPLPSDFKFNSQKHFHQSFHHIIIYPHISQRMLYCLATQANIWFSPRLYSSSLWLSAELMTFTKAALSSVPLSSDVTSDCILDNIGGTFPTSSPAKQDLLVLILIMKIEPPKIII